MRQLLPDQSGNFTGRRLFFSIRKYRPLKKGLEEIQADIAYRLAVIAKQYSAYVPKSEEKFSDTLYLSILQNLLTNCITLLQAMRRRERKQHYLSAKFDECDNLWGFNRQMIQCDTFSRPLTVEGVLTHIRNALSHPTSMNLDAEYCGTGYTTLPNEHSGQINKFCFVDSPDVKCNRTKEWEKFDQARRYFDKNKRLMPSGVTVGSIGCGKFGIVKDGKPFARMLKVELTPREIRKLVIGLANHLAQPIQENWDGETIFELVA